jgi:hypothetical protein
LLQSIISRNSEFVWRKTKLVLLETLVVDPVHGQGQFWILVQAGTKSSKKDKFFIRDSDRWRWLKYQHFLKNCNFISYWFNCKVSVELNHSNGIHFGIKELSRVELNIPVSNAFHQVTERTGQILTSTLNSQQISWHLYVVIVTSFYCILWLKYGFGYAKAFVKFGTQPMKICCWSLRTKAARKMYSNSYGHYVRIILGSGLCTFEYKQSQLTRFMA